MIPVLLFSMLAAVGLPEGPSPEPLELSHFPDRLHAFVWRNWRLVPVDRMADVVGASGEQIRELGRAMGLPEPPEIPESQLQRTYITLIRANWHLLNYDQLLLLLGWDASKLAYTLREDDFLFIKLGSLKPDCPPLAYTAPTPETAARQAEIAALVREHFGDRAGVWQDPPLSFVERLAAPVEIAPPDNSKSRFDLRFCYSYFALYGDPLIEQDPFPENYLKRLAATGVNGVWLHGVLYKLAPFPWQPEMSVQWEQRLERLRELTERAARYGIRVYLYMNEPRTMPLSFFERHPELRGVTRGDHAALCTSVPEVRAYLMDSVAAICKAAPELGGFFTITASENPTNCWSHNTGHECPRCGPRGPAEVIAEVNAAIAAGIEAAGSGARLLAWDWGWGEDWAPEAINLLPKQVSHMSVSEWHTPIVRGGIESSVGEYSISAVGPGPRARRHWQAAQEHGLATVAKIQANNTWELAAVPYIPAVANVAAHVEALRDTGVTGLMLGWTLGGHPSPNLEVVHALGTTAPDGHLLTADEAMEQVAVRRFGMAAPEMLAAWRDISAAFSEFPYHIGVVYNAPLQVGPANLLWAAPTGYRATMVGIPYDDLDAWRAIYPPDIFSAQLEKVAVGFLSGAEQMRKAAENADTEEHRQSILEESSITETAALHFQSVANQARFVELRNRIADVVEDSKEAGALKTTLKEILQAEKALAKRLHDLQTQDSRIGFEATNQYFYTPMDLVEKVLNCAWLETHPF